MIHQSPSERRRSPLERALDRVRDGDAQELERLLDGCRRYITLVSNEMLDRKLQSKIGASDLVQDTMLEAHDSFDHFEGNSEAELFAWLKTILKRRLSKSRDHFYGTAKRNVSRERSLDEARPNTAEPFEDDVTPSALVIAQDEERLIRKGMAQLADEYREVIELRNWERKSFAEIGEAMDRSPEAVRKLWGRAVEKLSGQLSTIK